MRAAVTISFLLIPAGIAYSSLANVPPLSGLLSCVFPLLTYTILGSSGQLGVGIIKFNLGPEAITSVLVGISVTKELEVNPEANPALIASAIGFLSGTLSVVMALFQAGFIDNILSGYLLTGFVLGVSNVIICEQLPGIFGFTPEPGIEKQSALMKLISHLKNLPNSNIPTMILSFSCITYMFICLQQLT
jgi:MFS superfamily sulfate permease-like transporter